MAILPYNYSVPLVSCSNVFSQENFDSTIQKVKDIVSNSVVQQLIGFGLGVGMNFVLGKVYLPILNKVTQLVGIPLDSIPQDPLHGMSKMLKVLLSPFICVIGPISEEQMFRGSLQGSLQESFEAFYLKLGVTQSCAHVSSRISAVFFSSVIFGLVHFSNALVFWCNPILFLPQVVAATLMGMVFGIAKEVTGDLHMPIGMHVGNNTFVWTYLMLQKGA